MRRRRNLPLKVADYLFVRGFRKLVRPVKTILVLCLGALASLFGAGPAVPDAVLLGLLARQGALFRLSELVQILGIGHGAIRHCDVPPPNCWRDTSTLRLLVILRQGDNVGKHELGEAELPEG